MTFWINLSISFWILKAFHVCHEDITYILKQNGRVADLLNILSDFLNNRKGLLLIVKLFLEQMLMKEFHKDLLWVLYYS